VLVDSDKLLSRARKLPSDKRLSFVVFLSEKTTPSLSLLEDIPPLVYSMFVVAMEALKWN
jgi:hypothetical protein